LSDCEAIDEPPSIGALKGDARTIVARRKIEVNILFVELLLTSRFNRKEF
jgi:hypothetical protein